MARSSVLISILLLGVLSVRCIYHSKQAKPSWRERNGERSLDQVPVKEAEELQQSEFGDADIRGKQENPEPQSSAEYGKAVEFLVDYTDPGPNRNPNSSAPYGAASKTP